MNEHEAPHPTPDATSPLPPAPPPAVWTPPPPVNTPPPRANTPPTRASGLSRTATTLAVVGALTLGAVGGGATGALMTRTLSPQPQTVVAPAGSTPERQVVIDPTATSAPPPTAVSAPAAPTTTAPVQPVQPVVVNQAVSGSVAEIYTRVGPSVVSIRSRNQGTGGGIGSGFIIDKEGHILTNNHVVQGAARLAVTFSDGNELAARVVGTAPSQDLALIKVEPPRASLVVAKLGDSDAVTPGEVAIAIGSPSGLEQTVTSGIVSSVGRTFGNTGGRNGPPLRGLIQTDAAINPGNSGGPLLNSLGEVIGINTLKAPETQGIGFAVPINTAKSLIPQLKAGGRVAFPFIGISSRAITPSLAETLKLPVSEGVLVLRVTEGGPAAKAGIKGSPNAAVEQPARKPGAPEEDEALLGGGDIITAINGVTIRRPEDIGRLLDQQRVGDKVSVTVWRNGQTQAVSVELAEWPGA